jgi:hypothetical protein
MSLETLWHEDYRHYFRTPPSYKQKLYFLLFELILPHIRNTEYWRKWKKLLYGNVFAEAELVHNLHHIIFEPEFTERDVCWFESQAGTYRMIRSETPFGASTYVLSLIDELDSVLKQASSPLNREGFIFPDGFRRCSKTPLSHKQEIYFMLFELTLPYIRVTETWPVWKKLRHGNVGPEAQLVHDLHRVIFDPEFTVNDVWWLQGQASALRKIRSKKPFGQSETVLRLLDELSGMVPDTVRNNAML